MSFLAPLFLAGIAAVSLPVLFHLIRRTPRGRVLFSSLMFLSPSPPRITSRSRLEHWPLLLLRALAVLLLALAFARPFLWSQDAASADETGPSRNVVILLDTSASMQQPGLWDQAKTMVDEAVSDVGPADRVALLTFDRSVRHIIRFDQWTATPTDERVTLLIDAMREQHPGWGATDLGQALAASADLLLERSGKDTSSTPDGKQIDASHSGPKRVILISDLQKGSKLAALQAYEWPKDVIVELKPLANAVRSSSSVNAGIELLAAKKSDNADKEKNGDEGTIRLRVINNSLEGRGNATANEKFKLVFPWFEQSAKDATNGGNDSINGSNQDAEIVDAYVPAGESRDIRVPKHLADWNGDRIELRGDDIAFDNIAYRVPRQPRRSFVLYLANDDPTDAKAPLYYLQRAFPPTQRRRVGVEAVNADGVLDSETIGRADLIVVADVLTDARVSDLRKAASGGKTILVAARSIAMNGTIAKLIDTPTLKLAEATVDDYAMLTNIDFTHRYFAPFADPRFGDFTKLRFWHHRSLHDDELLKRKDVHVIAKFDDNTPALIDVPVGTGHCVILTAAWHPEDGQLALSSKFVPLMNIILDVATAVPNQTEQFRVGDVVDLSWLLRVSNRTSEESKTSPATLNDAETTVTTPNGTKVVVGSDGRFSKTTEPGIYTVAMKQDAWRFAVNMDPRESQLSPMDHSELESRGVRLDSSTIAATEAAEVREQQLRVREMENRHKIWRGLIVAALAILLFETWLAGRYAARSMTETGDENATDA